MHKTPTKRIALVILVLVTDLFFTGIIFGWAPLLLLLLEEGQYNELCIYASEDDTKPCIEQEKRLNLMFTIAAFATNAASLPVGMFLDYCGPKRAIAIAGIIQIIGLLMMGFADSESFDVFLPAYTLLAIGGCITMIASYPASFLIMQYQTAVLAAISCLFDGSSIIFLLLYSLQTLFHLSRQVLFIGYACFAVVAYTLLVWLWHLNEIAITTEVGRKDHESTGLLEKSIPRNSPVSDKIARQLVKANYLDYGSLHEAALIDEFEDDEIHALYRNGVMATKCSDIPISEQIRTFEFAFILIYASIQVLRTSLYIGTNQKLLANYGDDANDFLYTKIFSLVLPLGFVFIPAIDYIVEQRGLTLSLVFTNALGLLFNGFVLVPVLSIQCLSFAVFTGFRAFLYAVMSAYTAKTFGLKNLGTLIGIIFSTSSFMSLLVYPAVTLSNTIADGDLSTVYWISLVLCLALIPLTQHHRQRERKRLNAHRALLSKFGRSIRSPTNGGDFATSSSQGLSYRRSPCLTDPTVRFMEKVHKKQNKLDDSDEQQRRKSTTYCSYEGA